MINKNRLFNASCFALIATAMTFAIRAGILSKLGEEFGLTKQELGFVNQMAFLGFPLAMIFGGPLYNIVGPQKIMWLAFLTHLIGIVMTIFAGGFVTLLLSTFFIGFANGMVEAACNPMISDMYEGSDKTKMLNRFHMWFPGGIVIGSLVSKFMTDLGQSWQAQVAVILIPTVIYLLMILRQNFPVSVNEGASSNSGNLKAMLSPLYIFMLCCMALTAISEFGPEQWIEPIMKNAGASPMLILALVTGVMAVGRYFVGPLVHSLNSSGILLGSAIITTIGIVLLSTTQGNMLYFSAFVFAIGVCYFWPTMIGFVAENIPAAGAFGMSIMGGMGMFSSSIFQPIIGKWLDNEKIKAKASGLTDNAAELVAGQATLDNIAVFPAILIVLFTILFFWQRKRVQNKVAAAHAH